MFPRARRYVGGFLTLILSSSMNNDAYPRILGCTVLSSAHRFTHTMSRRIQHTPNNRNIFARSCVAPTLWRTDGRTDLTIPQKWKRSDGALSTKASITQQTRRWRAPWRKAWQQWSRQVPGGSVRHRMAWHDLTPRVTRVASIRRICAEKYSCPHVAVVRLRIPSKNIPVCM